VDGEWIFSMHFFHAYLEDVGLPEMKSRHRVKLNRDRAWLNVLYLIATASVKLKMREGDTRKSVKFR
jgi:hypothetical protein